MKRFNWQIWAGFFLTLTAFLSYPFFFVRWPITRDFPWGSLVLFVVAAVLLIVGVRRAFQSGRSRRARIATGFLATVSVVILGFFVFSVFILARHLPASLGAPQVGQKAPDFSLSDTSGKQVSLAGLLSTPIEGKPPKGVLLVFYRGYW